MDPIVMLDAMLGATHNLAYLESELLDYSASIAPMPKSKKEKPSVSPADLAERLIHLTFATFSRPPPHWSSCSPSPPKSPQLFAPRPASTER